MSSIFAPCAGNNSRNNTNINKMAIICGAHIMYYVKHFTFISFKAPNSSFNEVR